MGPTPDPWDVPTPFSGRRALAYLLLVAWVTASLAMALFHSPNAYDETGTAVFHLSELVSATVVARLVRRGRTWAGRVSTVLLLGNLIAWSAIGGLGAVGFFAVVGSVFLLSVWTLPTAPVASARSPVRIEVIVGFCVLLMTIDLMVGAGAIDAGLRDDACFVWCE